MRELMSGSGSDPKLSEPGKQQALASANVYQILKAALGTIFVSSYENGTLYNRTRETAELLTGLKEFVAEPGIRERHFGISDGKVTKADCRITGETFDDGEPLDAHRERVVEALNRRLSEATKPPLFVAHGGTVRRIFEAIGIKEHVAVANAAVYQMVPMKGKWMIFELSVEKGKLARKDITPKATMGVSTLAV